LVLFSFEVFSLVLEVVRERELEKLEKLLSEHRVAVVLFTAEWCPPCRYFKPVFETLAEKSGLLFIEVYVPARFDKNSTVVKALEWGVQAVPTTLIVVNNTVRDMHVGYMDLATLENWIRGIVGRC